MRLGSTERENIPVIPLRHLSIDLALGVGGLPRGRVTEIYGPEASGKTTLALHVIAEAQRRGGSMAFIDAESTPSTRPAERLGVDVDNLLISQPTLASRRWRSPRSSSAAAASTWWSSTRWRPWSPRAEIDGNVGDQHVGLRARLMSHAMRKFTGVLSRTNTVLIFINQIRMKIGVMFGNPETTTGVRALKFYSSIRIDIRKTTQIKEGQDDRHATAKVKIVKNKVAPPFKQGRIRYRLRRGHLQDRDLLDLGWPKGWWTRAAPGTAAGRAH